MAQTVTIAGATYPDVPSIQVPKSTGGSALFVDTSSDTVSADGLLSGYFAHDASGNQVSGEVVIQVFRVGTSAPTDDIGDNGDLYFVSG